MLKPIAFVLFASALSLSAFAKDSRKPASSPAEEQRRSMNEGFASDPKSWSSTAKETLVAYCGGRYGEAKITKFIKGERDDKSYVLSVTFQKPRKNDTTHNVVYRGSLRPGEYDGFKLAGNAPGATAWSVLQHLSSYSHGGVSDKATIVGFDWDEQGALSGMTFAEDGAVEGYSSCQATPNRPGNWGMPETEAGQ